MARPTLHITGALFFVSTLFTPMVSAQGEMRTRGPRGECGESSIERLVEVLDLDEEQQSRIEAMRVEMDEDMEPMREEIQQFKTELEEAWSSAIPSRETIMNLNEWLLVMDGLIRERRAEFRFELLDLLDDTQRSELASTSLESEGESGGRNGRGPHLRQLAQRLELDDTQMEVALELSESLHENTAPAHDLLVELQQELTTLWAEEYPDEDAIFEIDEDMDDLRWMIRQSEVDFFLALSEVLDEEQRAMLSEVVDQQGGRGQIR